MIIVGRYAPCVRLSLVLFSFPNAQDTMWDFSFLFQGEDEDEMAPPGVSHRGEKQGRKKPSYSGGLVLDPKKGGILLDMGSNGLCFLWYQQSL